MHNTHLNKREKFFKIRALKLGPIIELLVVRNIVEISVARVIIKISFMLATIINVEIAAMKACFLTFGATNT